MKTFAVAFTYLSLGVELIFASTISTPIGDRPSQCVHFAEENNAILEIKDGLTIVHYPDSGRTFSYEALPECIDNAKEIKEKRDKYKNSKNDGISNYKDWVDYAYATVPTMGTFTAEYSLPDQDPSVDGGELLYYFIGLQNDDDAVVTIIQPVIVYCGNCGQWDQGWSMVPWNCCANGQTWYGTNVSVPKASEISAYISANDTTVVISSTYQDSTVQLTVADERRTFDWAAATLEEYDAYLCSLYPSLPFNVSNMQLIGADGSNISPKWETTGNARCDGGATVVDEQTVLIYGRDKPR